MLLVELFVVVLSVVRWLLLVVGCSLCVVCCCLLRAIRWLCVFAVCYLVVVCGCVLLDVC